MCRARPNRIRCEAASGGKLHPAQICLAIAPYVLPQSAVVRPVQIVLVKIACS